jgi:putative hydrolase of the HAD superfamily
MAVNGKPIKALFLDVGGVLGTNGWDHGQRRKAAEQFRLDITDLDARHNLTFDTYEEGKISLETYLDRVVFYRDRPFTRDEFRKFMFDQSQPNPEMISMVTDLKERYDLKVAITSNEGRELATHRIPYFGLDQFVDFYIFSCFIHCRKPDEDFFRLALDIAQVPPDQVLYLDDRAMFVEVAGGLGIRGIPHKNIAETKTALSAAGLV